MNAALAAGGIFSSPGSEMGWEKEKVVSFGGRERSVGSPGNLVESGCIHHCWGAPPYYCDEAPMLLNSQP